MMSRQWKKQRMIGSVSGMMVDVVDVGGEERGAEVEEVVQVAQRPKLVLGARLVACRLRNGTLA